MGAGEVVGYSIGQGLILFLATTLIGLFASSVNMSFRLLAYSILPIVAYLSSLALLSAVNYGACGDVSLPLIARASIFTPGAVLVFLVISGFTFFQGFVLNVLPPDLRASFGAVLAVAFYMFWAGMYGGAFGVGFANSCPNKK
jgi:hypothetical protein